MNITPFNLLSKITEFDYKNISDSDWPEFEQLKTLSTLPTPIALRLNKMIQDTESKRQKASKFCALAFHGREYRIHAPHNALRCCMTQPDNMQPILDKLLNGKEPKECEVTCWSLENIGVKSLREIKNATLDHLMDRDIINFYDDSLHTKEHPIYFYKIETSNICNSLCVTCSGKYSTAWRELERKNGGDSYDYIQLLADEQGLHFDKRYHDNDSFLSIDYARAKFINLFGGESTIDKTNYQILRNLVANGNTDCLVSFTTHGNFNLTPWQQELLLKFSRIHFNFSIDALEKPYEYVRYPLSWNKLLKNIDWCKNKNIEISVNWTLSNLTIFYYDEIKSWFEKNQIAYRISKAASFKKTPGREYHITSLSKRVKDIIIAKTSCQEVQNFLDNHKEQDELAYKTFLHDIAKQDRWKGISIYDYMPEFAKIISDDLDAVK